MAEFGGALDRYLEAPYVNAARDEADYEKWCESKGLDPEVDHWQEFDDARYEDYMGYEKDADDEKEWRDECDRAQDEEARS